MNEEVRKKCIGDDKVITCRPADLIEPELEKYRAEIGDEQRTKRMSSPTHCSRLLLQSSLSGATIRIRMSTCRRSCTGCKAQATPANNGPKTLYVEDLTNGNF